MQFIISFNRLEMSAMTKCLLTSFNQAMIQMPSWRHLLLLVVIVDVTSAGLKNVVVVQNFNLKTAVAAEISCSNIKSVLVSLTYYILT